MRPRPPSQIITYLEISESPPQFTHPTTSTYATLDHILCRIEHQKLFRSIHSLPHITLPWFHRHFLLSAKIQLPFFLFPKICSTPSETRLRIFRRQAQNALGIPTPQSNQSPLFHIYIYIYLYLFIFLFLFPNIYIYIYRRLLPRSIPWFQ